MMTLGSLFSGSGGFELAGLLNGIKPIWNAEIEKYPAEVTTARLPDVKNYGDVTRMNGAEIEPVDVTTFGSPCQDLSIAGAQKGIVEGERSSLFFEAVRIIKEMRDATDGKYPRFAVFENVPGMLTSGKGEDFQIVLQAFCDIGSLGLDHVPRPQKWQSAGCIMGDGYSVAWRVYNACGWGVPQRRKRVYLIADFNSERAGEVLFKPESLSRYSEAGKRAWEALTSFAEGSADKTILNSSGNGTIETLDASYWKGQGPRQGRERVRMSL